MRTVGRRRFGTVVATVVAAGLDLSGCTDRQDAGPTTESRADAGSTSVPTPSTGAATGSSGTGATARSQRSGSVGSSNATPTSAGTSPVTATRSGALSAPRTSSPHGTRSTAPATTPTKQSRPMKSPVGSETVPVSRSSGVETVVLNAEEIATRHEIETAWIKYWDVFVAFNKIPKDERPERFGAVAVDPELNDLLTKAAIADEEKIQNWGTVTHHVYWGSPVAGRNSAVIGDCTDQSKFGGANSKGEPYSVGGKKGNYNGTLTRDVHGRWKVSFLAFRKGVPC